MRHAQPAPDLRDLFIERQDRVRVIACDRAEPTSKASRLREVASMANCFNALAQLADRDRREEEGNALRRSIPKELTNTGVGASVFSRVADDVSAGQGLTLFRVSNSGTTWEQLRPNTGKNEGAGLTRKQDESTT